MISCLGHPRAVDGKLNTHRIPAQSQSAEKRALRPAQGDRQATGQSIFGTAHSLAHSAALDFSACQAA